MMFTDYRNQGVRRALEEALVVAAAVMRLLIVVAATVMRLLKNLWAMGKKGRIAIGCGSLALLWSLCTCVSTSPSATPPRRQASQSRDVTAAVSVGTQAEGASTPVTVIATAHPLPSNILSSSATTGAEVLSNNSSSAPPTATAFVELPAMFPTENAPSPSPVTRVNANLRAGPGTDYAIVGSALAGTPRAEYARTAAGDWLLLTSGAWIRSDLVDNAPSYIPIVSDVPSRAVGDGALTHSLPSAPVVRVNANLRAGPGTDYAIVGSALAGTPLDIHARTTAGDWLLLTSGAWIRSDLVDNVPSSIPIVSVTDVSAPSVAAPTVSAPAVSGPMATDVPVQSLVTQVSQGTRSDQSNAFTCIGACATPPDPSCPIKGNVNSRGEKIYHMPDQRDYERTDIKPEEGDRWFCSPAEAEAAGFRAAKR